MRKFRRGVTIVLILWGIVTLLGCQSSGPAQAADNDAPTFWQRLTHSPEKLTVPQGTVLRVRLDDTLSSNNSRGGDTFEATLADPVAVGKKVVIPQGANVVGQVVDATPSGHLKTPAALAVTLKSEVLKACRKLPPGFAKVYLTGRVFKWQFARDCAAMVLTRAISRRASRSREVFSSCPVARWKRRLKRSFFRLRTASSLWSSLIARMSSTFIGAMTVTPQCARRSAS